MACSAEVSVITPQGPAPEAIPDGVFTVHRLSHRIDRKAEARRDLLIDALSATSTVQSAAASTDAQGTGDASLGAEVAGPLEVEPDAHESTLAVDSMLAPLLDDGLIEPWDGATEVLNAVDPNLVVVVGARSVGARRAIDAMRSPPPYVLVAADPFLDRMMVGHFDYIMQDAAAVITATEQERRAAIVRGADPSSALLIGPPLPPDPSVLREPNPWVGDTGAVVVFTDEESADLANLVRLAVPDPPVGIASPWSFAVWHHGRLNEGWPPVRHSDINRLLAWAGVVVDLAPDAFLARRSLVALAFGTPIIVPAGTRAAEHAAAGGGLWFESASELVWTVDALVGSEETRAVLSAQGRAYAAAHYGSTSAFVDAVTQVVLHTVSGRRSERPPTADRH